MKKLQLILLAALAFANANAQKLPNKQEASVRIPSNVKIDGKSTEWNNQFQAYNISTEFYYTLANNNDDLYLIVQAKNRYVFNKIIDRGLTLTVKNTIGGKAASFTFPYKAFKGRERLSSTFAGDILEDVATLSEDELAHNNKVLRDNHKFIKVAGVEGVDSLVSLYNENGIKAAELFDSNRAYTLEIAVSLKLLGLSPANSAKIWYGLKVNPIEGIPALRGSSIIIGAGGRDITAEASPELKAQAESFGNKKFADLFGGTGFEGEYTLAK